MTQDATPPHNIFEAASRLEKERREKKQQKQAPPQKAEPAIGTQLSEIFDRCKKLHNQIATTLDQAFKKGGITPSQLRAYVTRPQNFSEKDWRLLEEQRKKTEAMIQTLKKRVEAQNAAKPSQPPAAPKAEPAPPQTPPSSQPPAPSAPPTKKPRIMTKRHWIGM